MSLERIPDLGATRRTLTEGHSTIDTEIAIISEEPFACIWYIKLKLTRINRVYSSQ
ncbi:MAG: hypothetical protein H0W58_13025 [Acidobacteria bacterium]|nr:hypothetical protein [Acidobacteriota bacterium]